MQCKCAATMNLALMEKGATLTLALMPFEGAFRGFICVAVQPLNPANPPVPMPTVAVMYCPWCGTSVRPVAAMPANDDHVEAPHHVV